MKPSELYEIWAPREDLWSSWAKPVLFHYMPIQVEPQGSNTSSEKIHWSPKNDHQTAIIINLAGSQAVHYGLICAGQGFRPIPLFNSCPGPSPLVDLGELVETLFQATCEVAQLALPPKAPPAFLVDSRRMDGAPLPHLFDNRWLVFPQDLPSANRLLAEGIRNVLLVQNSAAHPSDDLALILADWQKQGLKVWVDSVSDELPPRHLPIRSPRAFPAIIRRMLALVGLSKNSAGGFGSVVPSSGHS